MKIMKNNGLDKDMLPYTTEEVNKAFDAPYVKPDVEKFYKQQQKKLEKIKQNEQKTKQSIK